MMTEKNMTPAENFTLKQMENESRLLKYLILSQFGADCCYLIFKPTRKRDMMH